ncbi:unnamed protein product [Ilex paraguariensis]|uniref:Uncharacterized protein n=1 Tax=Ilex paraguariensis TaxID=185542 RepID=A0ABC8TW24_9AQUA
MTSLLTQQKQLVRDLEEAKVEVGIPETNAFVASLQVRPTLLDRIKEAQLNDPNLLKILEEIGRGEKTDFHVVDGVLRFWGSSFLLVVSHCIEDSKPPKSKFGSGFTETLMANMLLAT